MNEQEHFTDLFETHRAAVYQQVLRMTRSGWHAEEIVQDVFMRAWIHRDKWEAIADMRAWLFIITKRRVFDYVVKRSKEKSFYAVYSRGEGMSQASDVLLPFQCCQLLSEAEQQLSPRQKEVYYMKHMKGVGQKEIARCLNISEFTAIRHIKSSISIVRKHVLLKLEMNGKKRA